MNEKTKRRFPTVLIAALVLIFSLVMVWGNSSDWGKVKMQRVDITYSSYGSQYTGSGFGLPIEERRTPPLFACLYISFIVSFCQFAFSRSVQSLLTIFSALVGQSDTQR